MKVSREQAAEHRERIVDVASQRFRERGYDGIGVADLMKEAGLTHGGFYGHFASKEDLAAEASARALESSTARWAKVAEAAPERPLEAIVEQYLSPRHRGHPEKGCLVAAVGAEVPRQGRSVRQAVGEGVQPFLDMLEGMVPGRTKAARRKRALATYASLIGGLVLSRAVEDEELSDEVLEAVKAFVTR